MTDSNIDSHDPLIVSELLRTTLNTLHDLHNRDIPPDSPVLNTVSDSDRLSYLMAAPDPSKLVVRTVSKVIENEIHSFFDSFSTYSLQTNTVP